MNTFTKLSDFTWLVQPKTLSKKEFEDLVSHPLPFHRTAFDTEIISVFSFPEEYRLYEEKRFDLGKIRQRAVKTTDNCIYQELKDGVYQRVQAEKRLESSAVIYKYHPGKEFYGRKITAEEIMVKKLKILETLELVCKQVCTKEREYVNNFDLFANPTMNWWHPFALGNLECPLYVDKDLTMLDGINRPWNYFGKYGTSSPFHIDDSNLSSAILHKAGFTKAWIIIPPIMTTKFKEALEKHIPISALAKVSNSCQRKWTCAKILVTPKTLAEWGIKHLLIFQNPGEYIMLRGGCYHAVVNYGGNVARSVNFIDDRYFDMAIHECQSRPKNEFKTPFNLHTMKQNWHKYQDERIDWAKRLRVEFSSQTLFPVVVISDGPAAIASGSATSTPQAPNIEEQQNGEPSTDESGSKTQPTNRKRHSKSPPKPSKRKFRCPVEGWSKDFPYRCRVNTTAMP